MEQHIKIIEVIYSYSNRTLFFYRLRSDLLIIEPVRPMLIVAKKNLAQAEAAKRILARERRAERRSAAPFSKQVDVPTTKFWTSLPKQKYDNVIIDSLHPMANVFLNYLCSLFKYFD